MGGTPFPKCARCGCGKGRHHPLRGCSGQRSRGNCLMGCRSYVSPKVETFALEGGVGR